jgi:hypothetical protein
MAQRARHGATPPSLCGSSVRTCYDEGRKRHVQPPAQPPAGDAGEREQRQQVDDEGVPAPRQHLQRRRRRHERRHAAAEAAVAARLVHRKQRTTRCSTQAQHANPSAAPQTQNAHPSAAPQTLARPPPARPPRSPCRSMPGWRRHTMLCCPCSASAASTRQRTQLSGRLKARRTSPRHRACQRPTAGYADGAPSARTRRDKLLLAQRRAGQPASVWGHHPQPPPPPHPVP